MTTLGKQLQFLLDDKINMFINNISTKYNLDNNTLLEMWNRNSILFSSEKKDVVESEKKDIVESEKKESEKKEKDVVESEKKDVVENEKKDKKKKKKEKKKKEKKEKKEKCEVSVDDITNSMSSLKLEEKKTKKTERRKCKYVIKRGENKGKECGSNIYKDGKYCSKHKKYENKEVKKINKLETIPKASKFSVEENKVNITKEVNQIKKQSVEDVISILTGVTELDLLV